MSAIGVMKVDHSLLGADHPRNQDRFYWFRPTTVSILDDSKAEACNQLAPEVAVARPTILHSALGHLPFRVICSLCVTLLTLSFTVYYVMCVLVHIFNRC